MKKMMAVVLIAIFGLVGLAYGDRNQDIAVLQEYIQTIQNQYKAVGLQMKENGKPFVSNYHEYILTVKALNDVNRSMGLPTAKPLSKKQWLKLWPNGGPDANK